MDLTGTTIWAWWLLGGIDAGGCRFLSFPVVSCRFLSIPVVSSYRFFFSLHIDDTHRSRSVVSFLGRSKPEVLGKVVVSCVAVVVLATCGMRTTWQSFCVLRTPVPKCPPAQS